MTVALSLACESSGQQTDMSDEAADIEFVAEDAGAALSVAAARRVAPGIAAGPGNVLLIELLGDRDR
jgi:hypothetical protein